MRYWMPFQRTIDMAGQVFGELRVIERAGSSGRGRATWLCECSCGARVIVRGDRLRLGKKRSCDGLKGPLRHRRQVGRLTDRLTYGSWLQMRRRCGDPG